MRLENLYQNFAYLSPEHQRKFLAEFRIRRDIDMSSDPPKKWRKSPTTPKTILTKEEEAVMKMLGLKKKDLLALKQLADMPETEENESLFSDDLYETDD